MTSHNFSLRQYIDFVSVMTEKEIKTRYKHSILGFLWVVINPLLQMLIIGFVFSIFIKIPNYFLFLLTGFLPWQFFSFSLTKATSSFVSERFLLQKAPFPKEAIPLSIIFANFFHLLVSLTLLGIYLWIFKLFIFPQILILPMVLFWLLIITIGLSLLTASLEVKYRDVGYLIHSVAMLWFYVTPVLYSLDLVPSRFLWLFTINPLTSIFEMIHWSILGTGNVNWNLITINIIAGISIFALGILTYQKQHKFFVDWI